MAKGNARHSKSLKAIEYSRRYAHKSDMVQGIMRSAFRAFLLVAIPTVIVSIVILFVFGLVCAAADSLGNIVDSFFVSLPFWNEKWEYAWTLYFSLIIGGIVGIVYAVADIKMIVHYHNNPVKEIKEVKKDTGERSWESMSTAEKDMWLRDHYPEYYGHAPNPTFADLEKEIEEKAEKDRLQREQWELKRKLDNINDTLEKIHRGY